MTQPYEEYVDKTMKQFTDFGISHVSVSVVRSLLSDAWITGLTHSLNLIEKEKHDRKTNSQPNTV
jgi:hypothetical protein